MEDREELQVNQPNSSEPEQPQQPAKRRYSNNALIFRAIAAGYLIYLGYKMIKDALDAPKGDFPNWLSYVFAAIFVIAGVFFLITTYQHYRRNRQIEAEEAAEARETLPEPVETGEEAEDFTETDDSDESTGK